MKRTALFCISFLAAQPLWADDCSRPWLFEPGALTQQPNTELWADRLRADDEKVLAEGAVRLERTGLWLEAPKLLWDRLAQRIQASSSFRARTRHWLMQGHQATFERTTRAFEANQVAFQQADRQLRGEAEHLARRPQQRQTFLTQARLTTCPLGQDDWFIRARKVRIDRNTQRVYAHHARIDFKGVPVFYTPYISYPLSDRASGFLMPSFQSYQSPNRDAPSWLVGIPYYFNLAPNYDDTLTLYQFQDRGTLVDNAFRSLNTWQRSTLTTTWLDDQVTGTSRWRVRLDGTQRFGQGLSGRVHWQQVSDKDFFADIPLEPALTTRSFERRELRLDWRPNDHISAFVRHQDYLLLRNHGANYELRPQLGLTLRQPLGQHLQSSLYTEVSQFDIPIDNTRPEGRRTLIRPQLKLSWPARWGEIGATAQVQHNRYDLLYGTPGGELTVPMAEVHGTLVFERPADEWGQGWLQTLEPRLQYTHIPYVDQNALPNFDSGQRSLSFDNLFALNRFTGGDRIGDTQRLSFALTTRLLTPKGRERLRAALGQAFYLTPRRVWLTGTTPDATPRSDYFGQLRLQSATLMLDNTVRLADSTLSLRDLISRLRWRADRLTLLSQYSWQGIGQSTEKQLLLAGATWHVHGPWRVGGYMQYDYTANLKVQSAWSLGYESCCWKSELQLEETRLEDGRYNYSFRLVFTLKGLTTVGREFDQFLQNKLNF